MIKSLKAVNVGPWKEAPLTFGPRLNVITGDNGLGKSLLLDLAWFAVTGAWPAGLNPKLMHGAPARPRLSSIPSRIEARIRGPREERSTHAAFSSEDWRWTFNAEKSGEPAILLYSMADGGLGAWLGDRSRSPVVLTQREVFDGLTAEGGAMLINGLLADWSIWSDSRRFEDLNAQMNAVLGALSPEGWPYASGRPVRADIDDVRRAPTIKMPWGAEVPITLASSSVKRTVALAYMLVWAVNEYAELAKFKGKPFEPHLTLLIDDVESHLSPRRQTLIVPAMLRAVEALFGLLGTSASLQLILTTNSALVTSSIEGMFDDKLDTWHCLELGEDDVRITTLTPQDACRGD